MKPAIKQDVLCFARQPIADFLSKAFGYAILGTAPGPNYRVSKSVRGLKVETHYTPSAAGVSEKRTYKVSVVAAECIEEK